MTCLLCDRIQDSRQGAFPFQVHEFEHSFLYLGEHQYYPGYCVLVTKDHFREMTDMPDKIRQEFFQEMMQAHTWIQEIFRPEKMNMCSLGNVVGHVHWHFFPRYADDEHFKNPPWLQMQHFDSAKVTGQQRDELIQKIRTHIDSHKA